MWRLSCSTWGLHASFLLPCAWERRPLETEVQLSSGSGPQQWRARSFSFTRPTTRLSFGSRRLPIRWLRSSDLVDGSFAAHLRGEGALPATRRLGSLYSRTPLLQSFLS